MAQNRVDIVKRRRGPGRPFLPGNNANPGGRPAIARDFRLRCREFMEKQGWDLIIQMSQSPGRDQRQALELISAYAYGKPPQETKLTGDAEKPVVIQFVGFTWSSPGAAKPGTP